MDTSQSLLMGGTAIVVPGQMAYIKLPHAVIRNYVDGKFPLLSKCPDADFMKGYGHRWAGGHDLVFDVSRTMIDNGPVSALKQAGHILLTDLPTKAGIPIPLLSGSSYGQWLVDHGIPKGYLSVHWADGSLGLLSIAEGSTDLYQAIHGTLMMNTATFFDTFGEGGIEIALAWALKSPLFGPFFPMVGAAENILAGLISAYQSLSIHVDPLVFFGSAGTSALIGFGLSYGLAGNFLSDASIDGIRSGSVGAFFALSPAFGYGALAGFISFKLGKALAENHNASMSVLYKTDDDAFQQLLDEMCRGNIHLAEFLDRAEIRITLADDISTLSTQSPVLNDGTQILPDDLFSLNSSERPLPGKVPLLKTNMNTLPDDSPILTDWYRKVFY